MKQRIQTKWIKALRSGQYTQCTNVLADGDVRKSNFCCLGVLTNIYCEEKGKAFDDIKGDNNYMPKKVVEWAGVEGISPRLSGGERDWLANMNDAGASFSDIAALIEKQGVR